MTSGNLDNDLLRPVNYVLPSADTPGYCGRDVLSDSKAALLADRIDATGQGASGYSQPEGGSPVRLGLDDQMTCKAVYPHIRNSLFEWMTACMMLGIAGVLLVSPDSVANGNFKFLLDMGIGPAFLGPMFFLFGIMRLASIYANGIWQPWGPRMRASGALVAALLWGQLCTALFLHSQVTNSISMGVPVYAFLTVGELISCYRATIDVRYTA